jgi:hypothetical protein
MAEDSAYWAGTTIGDASSADIWKAPYSDVEYSDIWSKIMASNTNRGFVVAGYANDLKVYESTPPAMTINVATGSIFIRGRLYENTAVNTLTITANLSGNPRLDRIIARVNVASQTIRLFVLAGTPAATPTLPALTQTAATYEVSIAYIWVANGAASIANTDIHDEREFTCTSANLNDSYGVSNLISNSEFMGFSQLSGGATTNPPDGWNLVLTPSDIANYTRPSQMSRGRAVQITTDAANEGLSQTFYVKPSTMYSIKLLTRVTAGDVGSVVVTTNSAAPGTITRYTRRTAAWIEEKIFYLTEADATTMTVSLLGLNSGDIIQYGQVLAVEGYVPGPFRQFRETVMFTKGITDAAWNDTAKSTGTTTLTLTADFSALVLLGTKNIVVALKGRDSGGSGYLMAYAYGGSWPWAGVWVSGLAGDTYRCAQNYTQLDSSLRFTADVIATGAGTFDATIKIIGITT